MPDESLEKAMAKQTALLELLETTPKPDGEIMKRIQGALEELKKKFPDLDLQQQKALSALLEQALRMPDESLEKAMAKQTALLELLETTPKPDGEIMKRIQG